MHCPFLEGKYMLSCRALGEVYVPSTFDLDEYCGHDRHKICPFYCTSETDGRSIFTDEAVPKQSDTSSFHGSKK